MLEMSIDSIRVSVVNSQRVVILKQNEADRYLPIWIGSAEADAIAIKLQGISVPRPLTHDLFCSMIAALRAKVNFIVVSDLQNDTFYARIILEFVNGGVPTEVELYPDARHPRSYTADLDFTWLGGKHTARRVSEWREGRKRSLEVVDEDGLIFELCQDETTGEWLVTKVKVDSRPSDAIAIAVRVQAPIYAEEEVLEKAGIVFDQETGKPIPSAQATGSGEKKEVSEEELRKLSAFTDFINSLDLHDLGKGKTEEE